METKTKVQDPSRRVQGSNESFSLFGQENGLPSEMDCQVEDDWGLSMDFHLFAQHEEHAIELPGEQVLKLLCVESLTPLDMMHLGSGIHDATGHCAWTASFLLVHAIESIQKNYQCFTGKRVLELGCGTGIGGLAVALSSRTSHVELTDNDPQVLELCERNCALNASQVDGSVNVSALTWGDEHVHDFFDTVLATDVLYDLSLLVPLFQTAYKALSTRSSHNNERFFVLSHVPRACYNTENPPVEDLDAFIIKKASTLGFSLKKAIQPCEIQKYTKDSRNQQTLLSDALSMQEMSDIGASIFVFQKTSH